jgi:hypothetical protein
MTLKIFANNANATWSAALRIVCVTDSATCTNRYSMTHFGARSIRQPPTAPGAAIIYRSISAMGSQTRYKKKSSMPRDQFSPIQAQQVATAFASHGVDYMFIGKSGAILLGYPGTTQDVDVFPRKDRENGEQIVSALNDLGFQLDDDLTKEIVGGKDFVQIKSGPFDINFSICS